MWNLFPLYKFKKPVKQQDTEKIKGVYYKLWTGWVKGIKEIHSKIKLNTWHLLELLSTCVYSPALSVWISSPSKKISSNEQTKVLGRKLCSGGGRKDNIH